MKRTHSKQKGYIALHVYKEGTYHHVYEIRLYFRRNDKNSAEKVWGRYKHLYPVGYEVGEIDIMGMDLTY